MLKSEKRIYKILLKFDRKGHSVEKINKWCKRNLETVLLLKQEDYLCFVQDILVDGVPKLYSYVITNNGFEKLKELDREYKIEQRDKKKIYWDIAKFFGGYILGCVSAFVFWYFTHK